MDITKSSATAHASTAEKLTKLEERLRHELMDDERQELRYRILRLQTSVSKLPCSRRAPNEG